MIWVKCHCQAANTGSRIAFYPAIDKHARIVTSRIIILHGVPTNVHVAVKMHEIRSSGDGGVGAEELAQLRVGVTTP